MVFPPLYDAREMADYVRESFILHWRRTTRSPHPLLKDYYILWPCFSLLEAEGAVVGFELLEMVQVTFYAMLLNEAVEFGVVRCFMAEGVKSALVGLRWSSFKTCMSHVDYELREAQLQQWANAVEDFKLPEPRGEVGVVGCSLGGRTPLDIGLLSL
ncbi:hypothetical protein Cgig2_014165 [Carnegiea gigantea]|uniref:Uncharacterized protein n=1 Tax=Carnegiea gigantea TaxID=171969 RepID=A0A9Q1Q682_9CARY|nr:hypothetical protein Cgig2_014165 [Carnegiea gigantea]